MRAIFRFLSKIKVGFLKILRVYNNPETLKEWRQWHNTEQWIMFSEKWFSFLEWITILSLIEYVNQKTDVWQIEIIAGVSWMVFYAFINSIVVNLFSKIAVKVNSMTVIAVFVSGIITWKLYQALQVVISTISISN